MEIGKRQVGGGTMHQSAQKRTGKQLKWDAKSRTSKKVLDLVKLSH